MIGVVTLFKPTALMTPTEREDTATAISGVAADLKKYATGADGPVFRLYLPTEEDE